jgi:L-ascorbate metabolism protein UlaG (beta-lactamase superfamily)
MVNIDQIPTLSTMKARFSKIFGPAAIALLFPIFSACGATFQFSPLQIQTNKETVVNLATPANGNYDIEVSSNAVDWQALVTALSTSGSITHTDSAAPFLSVRHYRSLQLTNASAVTGDHLATEAGDVILHPGNHAGFILRWTNITIYVDPSVNVYAGFPLADLILLTHEHGDHFSAATINAIKGANAVILAPQFLYNQTSFSTFRSITTVLTNNMGTNLLGLRVDAIPAYNYPPGSNNHPTNQGNGYLLTIGGKRIYISGDTEDTPAMRALQNIDVAFLAMNQPYTMTVDQAVSAVRAFVPKVVYPYHYSPSTPATDLAGFKQQVMTNPGVEIRLRKWY